MTGALAPTTRERKSNMSATPKRDLGSEIMREAARLAALQRLSEVADQVPELVAAVEAAARETERAERAARRAAEQLAAAKAAELEARKAVRALVGATGVPPAAAAAFLGIAQGLCAPLVSDDDRDGGEVTEDSQPGSDSTSESEQTWAM